MEEKEILSGLLEKLKNDFQLSDKKLPVGNDYQKDLEEIKKYLIEKIIDQMEKNFERFLNTLYRIDLDENKLNDILSNKAVPPVFDTGTPKIKSQIISPDIFARRSPKLFY